MPHRGTHLRQRENPMAKAHTLVDNFNDDAIDSGKWATPASEFPS
jgi:hypothetical protein